MPKKNLARLISFSGFARLKGVHRNLVSGWVKAGYIIPTELGDRKMIDLDTYQYFTSDDIPKGRPVSLETLVRNQKKMAERIGQLEEKLADK